MLDFGGKTLIQRVVDQALTTGIPTYVASPDDELVHTAAHIKTSGKRTATDAAAEANESIGADHVIVWAGDEPTVTRHHIQQMEDTDKDCVLLKSGNEPGPSFAKTVLDEYGRVLFVTRENIAAAYLGVGVYKYSKESLAEFHSLPTGQLERANDHEQLRWVENGHALHGIIVPDFQWHSINTQGDAERYREYLAAEVRRKGNALSGT